MLLASSVSGGCRGCADDERDVASTDGGGERWALSSGKTAGEWVELQIAQPSDQPDRARFDRWRPDSQFLTFDAMAFLHDAFARAYGGASFDLFLPRLFDGPALVRLRSELESLERQLVATPDIASAKAQWGQASTVLRGLADDRAWLEARGALVRTARELGAFSGRIAGRGERLWILGS
jgi:hypothetical protein